MASVTFPPSIGGDGSTVTDDNNATTGLGNGGHRLRFVPSLSQLVAVCSYVVTYVDTKVSQVLAYYNTVAANTAITIAAKDEAVAAETAAELARDEAEAAWTAALAANPDLNPAVRMNPSTILTDTTIPTGYNAYSAGPVTIGEGTTITLNDHSNWSIV